MNIPSYPTRIWPLGTSAFQEFFSNFTEVSKCQKNGAFTSSVFLRNYGGQKKLLFFVFGYFWEQYWSQSDQILPRYSHQQCLQLLFNKLFSNSKKIFLFFIDIRYWELFCHRRSVGVVGKAAASKFEIPGSIPSTANFFLFFSPRNLPHLRKAEDFFRKCGRRSFLGGFFGKKLRILCQIYYINHIYDRRFTEDLRTPHFWQTNSNCGSWGPPPIFRSANLAEKRETEEKRNSPNWHLRFAKKISKFGIFNWWIN